jgi:formate hydrogenlyase subunit 3/multisubunit Na+/H+ antiporter MnhD subunit
MSLVLVIAIPILGAFLLPMLSHRSAVLGRLFGPIIIAVNLGLALSIWQHVTLNGPQVEWIGGFAAPLGIVFHVDQFTAILLLAIAVMTILLWPRRMEDPIREPVLSLVLMGAASGLALSSDLFNLFVFYELTAVASYGLVASRATGPSQIAAIRFLILSAAGSALALLGIALIYSITGSLNLAYLAQVAPTLLSGPLGMSAFMLILIGFGVKAELFPVNTWVPEVYASASSRVSAMLSGVVSKLAMVVILKVLITVYANTSASLVMLVVGLLTLVSGELAAYRAKDFRRMLAFSSIAQLGMVAMAFSVSGTAGLLAGFAIMLHHLLAKPALFLLAERWGGHLDRLTGAAYSSKTGAILFLFLALSLIGVPPLPGFWAKYLLLTALFGHDQSLYYFAAAVLLITTVIEAAYLMRILQRLYQHKNSTLEPHRASELVPALVLGGTLFLSVLVAAPLGAALSGIARSSADIPAYIQRVLPVDVPKEINV